MMYQRNGQLKSAERPARDNPPANEAETNSTPKEGIKINGYQQVIEMLTFADEEFRISLLRRIARQNPKLGQMIYQELVLQGIFKNP